jgi:hypothetical protein
MEKGHSGKARDETDNTGKDNEPPVMFACEAGQDSKHGFSLG